MTMFSDRDRADIEGAIRIAEIAVAIDTIEALAVHAARNNEEVQFPFPLLAMVCNYIADEHPRCVGEKQDELRFLTLAVDFQSDGQTVRLLTVDATKEILLAAVAAMEHHSERHPW